MGEPVKFSAVAKHGCQFVVEDGTERNAAFYSGGNRDRAQVHADYLNREHAGGRVAQAHCSHGHACDYDRINDPTRPLDEPFVSAIILCPEHSR